MDIIGYNGKAWDTWVKNGNQWTVPASEETITNAKNGIADIYLIPVIPVPHNWYRNDIKEKRILCLASGGGQQGPVLAALGANVTVFDNSNSQLEQDRFVAKRDGLSIKTVQGDMCELSVFSDESFDLIVHPVSNCFVPDIRPVWMECYRVLKQGGVLIAGFSNPLPYIFDFKAWDDRGELSVRYKIPYSDLEQLPENELSKRIADGQPLEFGHTLEDQIGGQLNAGFLLSGFFESTAGGDLLDDHIKTFIATKAEKHR